MDISRDIKPIATRFVVLRKRNDEGKAIRHKKRLTAKGFLKGNVHQTFAHVFNFNTLRTCPALAVQRGYCITDSCAKFLFCRERLIGMFM